MTSLVAYRLPHMPPLELAPADRFPAWVNETKLVRRCLPMSIASSSGWLVLNPTRLLVTWDGTAAPNGLTVDNDPYTNTAASIVGHGILSWQIPFVLQTAPGWSLLIRGPANRPKDGAAPLEASVETDTQVTSASMSWMLTRPGEVVFEAGEAIAMLVPFERGQIEQIEPIIRELADDPELTDLYADWHCRRQAGDRASYARGAQQKRVELRPFRHA